MLSLDITLSLEAGAELAEVTELSAGLLSEETGACDREEESEEAGLLSLFTDCEEELSVFLPSSFAAGFFNTAKTKAKTIKTQKNINVIVFFFFISVTS